MTLKIEIKDFILQNFLFTGDHSVLNDTDSLMQKGIVDSTGILELITHIEERYAISVQDSEMLPANLDSVAAIAAFVAGKLQAGKA
jgi:acyl carrier protein